MRKQPIWWILCFVFSITFLPITLLAAQAQPRTIDLSGQVKGTDGDPKKFARVQLEGPGSYIALTNSEGKFSFKNVIPGRYRVTVTQGNNVQKFSLTIEVDTLELVVKW